MSSVLNFLGNCVFQMSKKIKSLEEALLEEKPWQLKGEVTGQKRPENSLLEETVLFDHAVRMGKERDRAFLRACCRPCWVFCPLTLLKTPVTHGQSRIDSVYNRGPS